VLNFSWQWLVRRYLMITKVGPKIEIHSQIPPPG
jgi:hypothetical protein